MAFHDYRFLTHWRIEGRIDDVYEILGHPLDYPKWWKAIRSAVETPELNAILSQVAELSKRKADTFTRMELRGWLPYTLRWELAHNELTKPTRIVSESRGDFVGRGIWNLKQEGLVVEITFDWSVRAEKWFLRYFSPILKPLFVAHHDWIMEQGRQGLIQEIAKRSKGV